MKQSVLLISFCVFALSGVAQDRFVAPSRTFQAAPNLMTLPDGESAAGLAQTPMGYPSPLNGKPIPANSLVGINGHRLLSSNADHVLLWSDVGLQTVEAKVYSDFYPGLERIVFRLPAYLRGNAWITVMGRQSSNAVKIIVE